MEKEANAVDLPTQLAEIRGLLEKLYRGNAHFVHRFWTTENHNFGGSSPATLWANGRGHKVIEFLKAAIEGF